MDYGRRTADLGNGRDCIPERNERPRSFNSGAYRHEGQRENRMEGLNQGRGANFGNPSRNRFTQVNPNSENRRIQNSGVNRSSQSNIRRMEIRRGGGNFNQNNRGRVTREGRYVREVEGNQIPNNNNNSNSYGESSGGNVRQHESNLNPQAREFRNSDQSDRQGQNRPEHYEQSLNC